MVNIDVELAKPFIEATFEFLKSEIGLQVTKDSVSTSEAKETSQDINIILGIRGAVCGQVIYSMPLNMAKSVAAMMLGRQVETLDHTSQSALFELGNMIAGMSITRLDEKFGGSALVPPCFVAGKNIFILGIEVECLHASFSSELGNMDVTIALEAKSEHDQNTAA